MTASGAARRVSRTARAGRPVRRRVPTATRTRCPAGRSSGVMIALALACQPQLIIADEPTTALDVMVQAQVLAVLTGLVRELDLGLLLISHDLSVLGTTCDRVVVMYAGRVVEEGPARPDLRPSAPSVRGRAGSGLSPHRRRDRPLRAVGTRGRPSLSGRPPERLHLPCALSHGRPTSARPTDPALRQTGPGRAVACIHADGTNAKTDTPRAVARPTRSDGTADRHRRRGAAREQRAARAPAGCRSRSRDGAAARTPRASTASTSTSVPARSSRSSASPAAARRRSRGRCSGSSVRARAWSRTTAEPLQYSMRALRDYRRRVQLILQDPSGSLNPRQTVYESVAEGLRIHRVVDRYRKAGEQVAENELGRASPLACRSASAGAVLPDVPARAVRRPAAAGGDRGRARPRTRRHHRRRAGVEPRRVDPRRDPRAAAEAARRPRPVGARRHARPRAGVEHRRPDRRHVSRPDRRGRHDRARAERAAAPLHARAALGRPRDREQIEPIVLFGETPDPSRIPSGCRFHPRCPALQSGEAEAAGVADRCTRDDLPIIPPEGGHEAACWLVGAPSTVS